jgi:hypothetical protein
MVFIIIVAGADVPCDSLPNLSGESESNTLQFAHRLRLTCEVRQATTARRTCTTSGKLQQAIQHIGRLWFDKPRLRDASSHIAMSLTCHSNITKMYL